MGFGSTLGTLDELLNITSGTVSILGGSVQQGPVVFSTIGFQLAGTWSGAFQFQVSIDNVNWEPVYSYDLLNGFNYQSVTSNGRYVAPIAGFPYIRVVSTLMTSGTATVTLFGTDGQGPIRVTNHAANSLQTTALQGGAGSSVSPWYVNLRNSSGTEIATSGNPLRIDPTGTTAQPVTDNGGSLTVDGTVSTSNLPATVDTNYGTPGASTPRSAAMLGVGTTAVSNANPVPISDAGSTLSVDDAGGSLTVDGTVTANQGTPNTQANAWFVRVSDGTDAAEVKGASTPAVAADPALVVTLSPNTAPAPVVTGLSARPTYSTTVTGLVSAALATDIFTITGSATKTIYITKIVISASSAAGGPQNIVLIKRSAANTGGTSATRTLVPHDSNSAAATAVVRSYTANPSALGASVGEVRSQKILVSGASTVDAPAVDWDFAIRGVQGIVLRGTSQLLAVNLAGVTITVSSFNIYIEWTEE